MQQTQVEIIPIRRAVRSDTPASQNKIGFAREAADYALQQLLHSDVLFPVPVGIRLVNVEGRGIELVLELVAEFVGGGERARWLPRPPSQQEGGSPRDHNDQRRYQPPTPSPRSLSPRPGSVRQSNRVVDLEVLDGEIGPELVWAGVGEVVHPCTSQ